MPRITPALSQAWGRAARYGIASPAPSPVTPTPPPPAPGVKLGRYTFAIDYYGNSRLFSTASNSANSQWVVTASDYGLIIGGLYAGSVTNSVANSIAGYVKARNPLTKIVIYIIWFETQMPELAGAEYSASNRVHGDMALNLSRYQSSTVTSATATVITDSSQSWGTNAWVGTLVRFTSGSQNGQTRTITANTATTFTLNSALGAAPAVGDSFRFEASASAGGMFQRNSSGARVQWTTTFNGYDMQLVYGGRTWKGKNYPELYAETFGAADVFGGIANVDGFFIDNLQTLSPTGGADYLLNGTNVRPLNNSSAKLAVKAGHRRGVDRLAAVAPTKIMVSNTGTLQDDLSGDFSGCMSGALMENGCGSHNLSWSLDGTFGSWSLLMSRMRSMVADSIGPKMGLLQVYTNTANKYKDLRYGLAASKLVDGVWIGCVDNTAGPMPYQWFDEYEQILGDPIDPSPTAAWSGTVWRRRYQYGCVVVNPRGSATQSVACPGYRFIGPADVLVPIARGTATGGTATTLTDTAAAFGSLVGRVLVVMTGANAGDRRTITANSATSITVAAFDDPISAGDKYWIQSATTQDPSVNNGNPADSFSLPGAEGRILLNA